MSEAFAIVIFANFIPVTVRHLTGSAHNDLLKNYTVGLRDLVVIFCWLRSHHRRGSSCVFTSPQDRNHWVRFLLSMDLVSASDLDTGRTALLTPLFCTL